MTDVTEMSHVADAIDRLMHGGVNHGEDTADYAESLLTDYPTVQVAVVSYIDSKITQAEFDSVVGMAIQVDRELEEDPSPAGCLPFATHPAAPRVHEYVKLITGFVLAYNDLDQQHPRKLSVSDAIDWFIGHDTRLQAESPKIIQVVKRLVTERVSPDVHKS